jgi:DNA polymerase-1
MTRPTERTSGAPPEPWGPPDLCLVDGSALAYRSHFAFIRDPLVNSAGLDVSAVFGFLSSLVGILERRSPRLVAVVFDTPEKTFRHHAYAEYKATRPPTPDALVRQLPLIRDAVDALGVRVLEMPGYEADDVIGTIAARAAALGMRSLVVSGDKDLLQLVGDSVRVHDPGKDLEFSPAEVERVFGVPPDRVVEVLGLMGDSSDNIPGVPGVGKKTATDLIARYGTIERVIEHAGEIAGPARRKSILANAELALRSRALATIDRASPVDVEPADLARSAPDRERLVRLLRSLELPSLLRRLVPENDGPPAGTCPVFESVTDGRNLRALVETLRSPAGFAVDLETTSLDPTAAAIVGVSFSNAAGRAWYVPLSGAGAARGGSCAALAALRPLLEDPSVPKTGQNLKFDYAVLRCHGVELSPVAFDTMLASYVLDPERRSHGLAALALDRLGRTMTPIEDLIGKGAKQLTLAEIEPSDVRDHACADAETAFVLTEVLRPEVEQAGLSRLLAEVELPLVPVLARMELEGVAVDAALLGRLSADYGREAESLRRSVWAEAGTEFNLDSPKQLGEVLFRKLGLRRGRRTKTGFSTDERTLLALAADHEIAGLILSYRQLAKLRAGYLDALPKLIDPRTGRVHTTYNQAVAATGRLSSSNPNLQNIPTRSDLGRQIRKAFVAPPGRVLVSADYSQIELRIMAHLSGDEGLIEAFRAGKDLHRATAALIFGADEEAVTREQRDWAKTVNFGIMYGMTSYGLARDLGIDAAEAQGFIDRYFATYPRVREYTERAVREAARTGWSSTILGRRRPIRGLDASSPAARGLAERTAVNTPIQGTAADMIKLAMIEADRLLGASGVPARMVLQVHDELVFEADEGAAEEVAALARRSMERPPGVELCVPVVVNASSGPDWLAAH